MFHLQNDTKATVKEHPQIYLYDKNTKQKTNMVLYKGSISFHEEIKLLNLSTF